MAFCTSIVLGIDNLIFFLNAERYKGFMSLLPTGTNKKIQYVHLFSIYDIETVSSNSKHQGNYIGFSLPRNVCYDD